MNWIWDEVPPYNEPEDVKTSSSFAKSSDLNVDAAQSLNVVDRIVTCDHDLLESLMDRADASTEASNDSTHLADIERSKDSFSDMDWLRHLNNLSLVPIDQLGLDPFIEYSHMLPATVGAYYCEASLPRDNPLHHRNRHERRKREKELAASQAHRLKPAIIIDDTGVETKSPSRGKRDGTQTTQPAPLESVTSWTQEMMDMGLSALYSKSSNKNIRGKVTQIKANGNKVEKCKGDLEKNGLKISTLYSESESEARMKTGDIKMNGNKGEERILDEDVKKKLTNVDAGEEKSNLLKTVVESRGLRIVITRRQGL
ncbi:hypothetical protein BC829DRAFT_444832 [Chytridium lagenaria]|nr:hypothetical protein BC829DRAFT_444832 [Chytridium lagenaria]